MSVLALPMAPAGSVQEQVTQQYAYLVQMAQQLNLALGQLEALGGGAGEASAGGRPTGAWARRHRRRRTGSMRRCGA